MKNPIVRYPITFCILIAFYLAFAFTLIYLPEGRIKHSVEKSIAMGDIKTDYPRAIVNKEVCRMDCYSDALILNQMYCSSIQEPLRSVMLVPSIGDEKNKTEWLNEAVSGVTDPVHIYPRYWHGSTFFMRLVMLLCGRYANLQLFLFYTSSIALFMLLVLLCRKRNYMMAICLFLSMMLLKCYVSQFLIHLYSTFIISIIAAIIATFINSINKVRMLLFITGSVTAYFDLMTTPLLTLGIPLLVVLSNDDSENDSYGSILKEIVIISVLWGLGYATTWIAKWVIATLLTGTNVIADALSISKYRINGDVAGEMMGVSSITVWDAVYANVSKCPIGPILALILLFAMVACFEFKKKGIKMAVVYLTVSLFPILYFIAISNQTYVHCWFTYRALVITVAGVLMALASVIDWERLEKRIVFNRRWKHYERKQLSKTD